MSRVSLFLDLGQPTLESTNFVLSKWSEYFLVLNTVRPAVSAQSSSLHTFLLHLDSPGNLHISKFHLSSSAGPSFLSDRPQDGEDGYPTTTPAPHHHHQY